MTNWVFYFRIAMVVLVVAAIVYTGVKTSRQLSESDFDFRNVRWRWWLLAVVAYVAAMTLSCLFWHRVLRSLGQHVGYGKTFLAFFTSQLGKYVPGKAMVVVIRTDIIRGDKVSTAPAAASVFVETLTWLFVGAAIGSLLLVLKFREQTWLLIAAVLMTIIAGSLTSPPIFQRIAKRLGVAKGRQSDRILAGLNWPTMSFGWIVMSLGWCLNGLSLWLVIYGIVGEEILWSDYPLALACVSLATVAGFVSLLPGGLGVRELVMIPLLGARFGSVTAVVAAVAIRLVWLAAELGMSGIMWSWQVGVKK
jgi:uncharacterized membrane protein YbhN (UPF0104 family)